MEDTKRSGQSQQIRQPFLTAAAQRMMLAAVVLAGLALAGCGSSGGGSAPVVNTVQAGQWGGPGINMVVSSTGAQIGYHCATGTITQPLVLDSAGHFSATGNTHVSGPTTNTDPTTYTGTVTGNTMTMVVTVSPSTTGATYTLTFGQQGDISSGGACPR